MTSNKSSEPQLISHSAHSYRLGRFLTALAGVVITPVLLMALIFGAIFVTLERDRLQNEAERMAQTRAATIDREFNGHISALQALSTSPSLENHDYELFQQQAGALAKLSGGSIVLRSAEGQVLSDTGRPWGSPLPKLNYETDATTLSSHQATVSKLIASPDSKGWFFLIDIPIEQDSQSPRLLSLVLNPESIEHIMPPALDSNWTWSVVDTSTRVVMRSKDPKDFIGRLGLASVSRRVTKPSGSFVTKNMSGDEILYAYAISQLTNWRVGVTIPKQDVEAPLWRMITVWGLLTAIIVTAAVVAVALVNNRLRHSVSQLIDVSKRLGVTDTVDPVITGVKEFDSVSEALSAASISLREKTFRIRENEQRMRTLLDNLFVYVGLLDHNGIILEANAAPMKAAGLRREDVIGRPYWETYWWSWSPSVKTQIEKAVRDAAEGRTVRFDVDIRMAGGVLHTIDFQLAPLRAADGTIVYLLPSAVDITDRKAAEQKLQDSVSQLEATYATAPVGLFLLDRQLRFISVNQHQALFDERSIADHLGKSFRDVVGDGAKQLEPHLRQVVKVGRPVDQIEFTSEETTDGKDARIFMASLHPLISPRGDILGVSAAVHEITDRKRAEERQEMLSRELQHRVKNNLATVEAIARATSRNSKTVEEFMERFSDRITSLSRTHTLVSKTHFSGVELSEIIKGEMKPYDEGLKRIVLSGPAVRLETETALTFGMAIHELATNAVKYGALSTADGQISVTWEKFGDDVHLLWQENGGPPVEAPKRKGFGSQLLQKILAKQLNGKIDVVYETTGLLVKMDFNSAAHKA